MINNVYRNVFLTLCLILIINHSQLLSHGVFINNNNNQINVNDNNNNNQITISGISSGGFMAVQFHIAYSSIVSGAAIIAGGPYFCAKDNVYTALNACMVKPDEISIDELIVDTTFAETSLTIDKTSNLENSKVWLYSGTKDTVVVQGVMEKLLEYYQHYISNDNIKTVFNIPSEHSFVTNTYGNQCDYLGPDYINNCNYSSSYELLDYFYGPLNDPISNASTSNIVSIDQTQFIPLGYTTITAALNSLAYAYIPTNCQSDRSLCSIHIAFHGCEQTVATIGNTFYTQTGYNEIAETNSLIILYPQALKTELNPKGCWDWWGITGPDYASQIGAQISTIHKMLLYLSNPSNKL